jgi:hypothetical protein
VKAQLHQAQLNVKHLSDQLLETDRDRARVVADNQVQGQHARSLLFHVAISPGFARRTLILGVCFVLCVVCHVCLALDGDGEELPNRDCVHGGWCSVPAGCAGCFLCPHRTLHARPSSFVAVQSPLLWVVMCELGAGGCPLHHALHVQGRNRGL